MASVRRTFYRATLWPTSSRPLALYFFVVDDDQPIDYIARWLYLTRRCASPTEADQVAAEARIRRADPAPRRFAMPFTVTPPLTPSERIGCCLMTLAVVLMLIGFLSWIG
jgi:hypothetical protein